VVGYYARIAVAINNSGGIRRRVDDNGLAFSAATGSQCKAGKQNCDGGTHENLLGIYPSKETRCFSGSFSGPRGNLTDAAALCVNGRRTDLAP